MYNILHCTHAFSPQACLTVTGCSPALQEGFNWGSGWGSSWPRLFSQWQSLDLIPSHLSHSCPFLYPSHLNKCKPPLQARFSPVGWKRSEVGTWILDSDRPGLKSWGVFCRATWKQEHRSDHFASLILLLVILCYWRFGSPSWALLPGKECICLIFYSHCIIWRFCKTLFGKEQFKKSVSVEGINEKLAS